MRSSSASAAARSATTPRRARKSSTSSAPSTCARASRSSTPRPTACFRSPPTRTSFPSKSSTASTTSRSNWWSAGTAWDASSRGRSSEQPGSFTRTANRRDFAMTPTAETVLDRLKAAHLAGRCHRQDRRSVRGPRHHPRDSYEKRRRGCGCRVVGDGVDAARVDLREPRRFRHAVRAPQRRRRAMLRTWSASTRG